jgi:hypothetical protein
MGFESTTSGGASESAKIGAIALSDKIKRDLEHVRDFSQGSDCPFSPATFQVGNVALSEVCLGRDVVLRFATPLAQNAQRTFSGNNSVNNFFRNEWDATGNLFARAHHQARSTPIFVGLLRLGSKRFVVLARKDSDLAFVRHLEPEFMTFSSQL